MFTTRSGSRASSDLIHDSSRCRPGVRCASEICRIRSGLAPAAEHGDVVAAQREPVALDDGGVADDGGAGYRCGPDQGLVVAFTHGAMPAGLACAGWRGNCAGARQDGTMTELKDRLRSDLTAAMKARDEVRTRTLRMAADRDDQRGGRGQAVARAQRRRGAQRLLTREAKRRREAAEAFDAAGRTDQAAAERAEGEVLGRLPACPADDDELTAMVAAAIAETGAAGMAAMGQVMKAVTPLVAGRAEGGRVAAEVRRALAG